jgi:hypothetical protein
MADKTYLFLMLIILAAVMLFVVPSLFRRKCGACSQRNKVDAEVCAKCGAQL